MEIFQFLQPQKNQYNLLHGRAFVMEHGNMYIPCEAEYFFLQTLIMMAVFIEFYESSE